MDGESDERKRRRREDEDDSNVEHTLRDLRAQQQSVDLALRQLQGRGQELQQQPKSPLARLARHDEDQPQDKQRQLALQKISNLTDEDLELELRRSEMQLELLRKELSQREQQQLMMEQQRLLQQRQGPSGASEDLLLLRRIREEQRSLEEQMLRLDRMSSQLRGNEGSPAMGAAAGAGRGAFSLPQDDIQDRAFAASSARLRELASVASNPRDLPLGLRDELEAVNRMRSAAGLSSYGGGAPGLTSLNLEGRQGTSLNQMDRKNPPLDERTKILRGYSPS